MFTIQRTYEYIKRQQSNRWICTITISQVHKIKVLWKYGITDITDTVPTRTGYYGYNDTTGVVVELTLIFL